MTTVFARLATTALLAVGLLVPADAVLAQEIRSGRVEMTFDLSAHGPGEAATLWLPYPTSDRWQEITDVTVTGDYARAAVYTERRFGTPMLAATWDAAAASRTLQFSFRVRRTERLHRDLSGPETPWSPEDYAQWLAPTALGPTDGVVKALAERITAGKGTVLEKARAVYDWVCENTFRDPETRGCGAGDVCSLLAAPGGKCADIHSVFIALARAAGVPSREVFGLRQGGGDGEEITTWQHCWAEFYLPGTGWIVVDPADVRKQMLKRELTAQDAVPDDLRAYFWGGVDAQRVGFGVGRDLILAPPQRGGPLNYLMYPYAEVGGRALDWLDPASFQYRITYRTL